MSKLLSVIIPVYNVADYLPRCLDSVFRQGLSDEALEVILVNDGSTDRSAEVCVDYANRHPLAVKYISKENGGVSSARNEGMKAASGAYLTFVDADDYLLRGGGVQPLNQKLPERRNRRVAVSPRLAVSSPDRRKS